MSCNYVTAFSVFRSRFSPVGLVLVLMVSTTVLGQSAQPGGGVGDTFDPNGSYDNVGLFKDPGGGSTPIRAPAPPGDAPEGGTPPANDACTNATVIPGNVVTYNPALLNTTGATVTLCDAAESCESGNVGTSNSVWYSYTPALSGTVTINTFGSTYNTVLSVWTGSCGIFTGSCINVPTQLACNDDYPFGNTSQVTLPVTAGLNYKIKVSDYNTTDGGGTLDFNLFWAPLNDICAEATVIHGVTYDPPLLATNNAAGELCENQESSSCVPVGTSNSVWYSYTTPCDGFISLNTNGSNYDTVLSVWDKCGAFFAVDFPCNYPDSSPVQIACDDDSGTGTASQLTNVSVTGGQTYLIKVADYNTTSGGGNLDFNFMFIGASPPTAAISSPAALACVCGSINVQGTASASGAPMTRTLEYQVAGGSSWTLISSGTTAVTNGTLGTWNTSGLAQNYYTLRLTVQNACGLVNTAVATLFVDALFDSLEVRAPNNGDIVAGTTCVDGTVWDRCITSYTVMYRPSGGGLFTPVDPGMVTYNMAVLNDPLAGPGWNTTGLADGDYELRVQGSDGCGHVATVRSQRDDR
ncbi:MAG TPA: hypothetical protein VGM03_15275 [Phycisphaerae bacterium]